MHHRQPRGAGGTRDPDVDSLERLLLCCGGRLALGCHGRIEHNRVWAEAHGYLVPHGDGPAADPARVPVTLWSGRRVLLGACEYFQAPGDPYAA